jgi:hypothetical protein
MPRFPYFDAELLGFCSAGNGAAIIIGQDDNRAMLQARVKARWQEQ